MDVDLELGDNGGFYWRDKKFRPAETEKWNSRCGGEAESEKRIIFVTRSEKLLQIASD